MLRGWDTVGSVKSSGKWRGRVAGPRVRRFASKVGMLIQRINFLKYENHPALHCMFVEIST